MSTEAHWDKVEKDTFILHICMHFGFYSIDLEPEFPELVTNLEEQRACFKRAQKIYKNYLRLCKQDKRHMTPEVIRLVEDDVYYELRKRRRYYREGKEEDAKLGVSASN